MLSSAARRPLRDRLILRLLELVDASPERRAGQAVTPKISQSTLAGMIGVSRENVNRTLAALAIDGAIRQEDGRYVLIDEEPVAERDVERLATPDPPRPTDGTTGRLVVVPTTV